MDLKKKKIKVMIKSVFGKAMENLRKHRDIKLVTTDEKRSKLISKPNYHTTKRFSENLLAIEMKKTKLKDELGGKIMKEFVALHPFMCIQNG